MVDQEERQTEHDEKTGEGPTENETMTKQEICTIGVCSKCSSQVVTPIPDALRGVITKEARDHANELADRLQLIVLRVSRILGDAKSSHPLLDPHAITINERELKGILRAATTPTVSAP